MELGSLRHHRCVVEQFLSSARLVFLGRQLDDLFELLVKIGWIVEPAGEADLLHILAVIFDQDEARVRDADLGEVLKITFSGLHFKIPAKRSLGKIDQRGYLGERNGLRIMLFREREDLVYLVRIVVNDGVVGKVNGVEEFVAQVFSEDVGDGNDLRDREDARRRSHFLQHGLHFILAAFKFQAAQSTF